MFLNTLPKYSFYGYYFNQHVFFFKNMLQTDFKFDLRLKRNHPFFEWNRRKILIAYATSRWMDWLMMKWHAFVGWLFPFACGWCKWYTVGTFALLPTPVRLEWNLI